MNIEHYWPRAMSFEAYHHHIEQLYQNQQVTGPVQSQSLLDYTALNLHRMRRLLKTFEPRPEALAAWRSCSWLAGVLAITEGWCGDASQIMPVAQRMAADAGLSFRCILRDDNLELMDAYLTNGSRSIPILLFFDRQFKVVKHWGPRPAPMQKLVIHNKQLGATALSHDEIVTKVHALYASDKQQAMQQEWSDLLS